ncbi:MAG: serine/threonine protein kinase [bacterium]
MNKIDGYQIFAELKQGPVTTIYKAVDSRHQRVVLIKLLNGEAAALPYRRTQFMQEGKISQRLQHPNLRRTLHTGTLAEQPFLALEYVEGPTLAELIQAQRKLPLDLCVYLAKEVAGAIAAVHRHKFLHHDIKPQNIFLSYDGAVKLGDLGMARELAGDAGPFMAGTPAYMSPEYVLGHEIEETSDLFSFGAVLYEMITGEVAFVNRTLSATLMHVANWEPAPLTRLRPETPADLIAICQKLLAKNPRERFASAEEAGAALQRLERRFGVSTTAKHLTEFLEAPERYRRVQWQAQAPSLPPKPARTMAQNWGFTALVSATMFMAGVLFIKGVKGYVDHKNRRVPLAAEAGLQEAPLHSTRVGYLDLHVTPGGVVWLEGDSIATAPLSAPLALPNGLYEVAVKYPGADPQHMKVYITAGDTLRKRVSFAEP